MTLRWLLAALHPLTLGPGLGAILDRASATSVVQTALVVLMVFAATAMARGIGY